MKLRERRLDAAIRCVERANKIVFDLGHETLKAKKCVRLRMLRPLFIAVGGENKIDGAADFVHSLLYT